eukprot:COSAG02_NODE_2738_length_8128_cov_10.634201_4_plen_70_part_00
MYRYTGENRPGWPASHTRDGHAPRAAVDVEASLLLLLVASSPVTNRADDRTAPSSQHCSAVQAMAALCA